MASFQNIQYFPNPPISPMVGDTYFDKTTGFVYMYANGKYVQINQTLDIKVESKDTIISTKNGESLTVSPLKIESSIYPYELFAMIETMKQFLEDLGISENMFNEKYEKNKMRMKEILDSVKVANKLMEK